MEITRRIVLAGNDQGGCYINKYRKQPCALVDGDDRIYKSHKFKDASLKKGVL